MNLIAPVSSIMATDISTVVPKDSVAKVKVIFDNTHTFHIPVVKYKKVVGMVNKRDFTTFCNSLAKEVQHISTKSKKLEAYTVAEIMSEVAVTLECCEQISVALDMFQNNDFTVIPIICKTQLIGLLTAHEVMKVLANEQEHYTIF